MYLSLVSVVCLSGRGLCNGPIPRPEESYRLWCVIVCDLGTWTMKQPWTALGCRAREKKYGLLLIITPDYIRTPLFFSGTFIQQTNLELLDTCKCTMLQLRNFAPHNSNLGCTDVAKLSFRRLTLYFNLRHAFRC
jgi:hypothetical protein